MSRHRHRSTIPAFSRDAAPRARGVYPSAPERDHLIRRREKLLRQLILIMVTASEQGAEPKIDPLIREYGAREVQHVLETFQRHAQSSMIADAATSYRHYRLTFARFGGGRPFLSEAERGRFQKEHAALMLPRDPFGADLPVSPREAELDDLLLNGDQYWDDLTPPTLPPRPTDFAAPAPGQYPPPVHGLLAWGWELNPNRYVQEARHPERWQAALPELARMTLDLGLLRGWPGQPASWAPYHALHLLGQFQAHAYAAPLLALLEEPDDWLSDCLPVNWGLMGQPAATPLWEYADDRRHAPRLRAVCLSGLACIAEQHPQHRADILRGFITRLENSLPFDATFNGYLVFILDHQLHAQEACAAIEAAYQQKKIDPKIMTREDVGLLKE